MATDPERVKAIFLAAVEAPDDAAQAAYGATTGSTGMTMGS
jgi:hypothetical protein